jgi:hypothetical protein
MSKKEILLDDTLLQLKNLEESISKNTKGILASVMKEEIASLVKESLGGDTEEVKEQVEDDELEMDLGDEGSEEEIEFDMEDEGDEEEMDVDFPAGFGDEEEDFEAMGDEELDFDMEDELEGEDEDLVDITNMSDEELVKVFKLMGDQDGVIVQKEDDEIHLKDENADVEYEIQLEGEDHELEEMMDLDEMEDMDESEEEMDVSEMEDMEVSEMEDMDEEEVMYEIEFDEEEDEEEEEEVELEETYEEAHEGEAHKEEAKEAARTLGNGRAFGRKGLPKPKAAPRHLEVESYKKQISQLKEKNEEYKKALDLFRTKLNEVAIFNSNLAYATRLFTEHSTTKQEKINILKRFDNVETLKESKNLYKSIKNELVSSTNVVTESVVNKVQKTPQKGSTNLVESKTYENAQFLRMKDLMNKINK